MEYHTFKNLETDKVISLRDNSPQFTAFIRDQNMYQWLYIGSEEKKDAKTDRK